MRNRILAALAALALPLVTLAARNSSGTESLVAGNPVVAGQVITASWANSTLNDIASELTNSLDRNGRGGMLSQLRGLDGTAGAPAFSFTSEAGSGLYRIGSNDFGFSVAGSKVLECTASGSSITGTFGVSGATTLSSTLAVTGASTLTGAVAANGGATVTGTLGVKDSGGTGQVVSVAAPSGLAAGYNFTLPTALPGSTLPLLLSSAGQLSTGQIVAAQIANATITSTQISGSAAITGGQIANTTITRANLASIGQQISSSSGNWTTTSGTYVDVTNLTVTITTSGRPVMLFLQSDGSVNTSYIGNASGTMQLLRGASAIGIVQVGGSAPPVAPPSVFMLLDTPAAGTYTYKMQAYSNAGGTFYVAYTKLVAYEM